MAKANKINKDIFFQSKNTFAWHHLLPASLALHSLYRTHTSSFPLAIASLPIQIPSASLRFPPFVWLFVNRTKFQKKSFSLFCRLSSCCFSAFLLCVGVPWSICRCFCISFHGLGLGLVFVSWFFFPPWSLVMVSWYWSLSRVFIFHFIRDTWSGFEKMRNYESIKTIEEEDQQLADLSLAVGRCINLIYFVFNRVRIYHLLLWNRIKQTAKIISGFLFFFGEAAHLLFPFSLPPSLSLSLSNFIALPIIFPTRWGQWAKCSHF